MGPAVQTAGGLSPYRGEMINHAFVVGQFLLMGAIDIYCIEFFYVHSYVQAARLTLFLQAAASEGVLQSACWILMWGPRSCLLSRASFVYMFSVLFPILFRMAFFQP